MKTGGRHGKALANVLANARLPESDKDPVSNAMRWYAGWVERMEDMQWQLAHSELSTESFVNEMVDNLNKYKTMIDMLLIYDSKHNFLYRNRGQLKLTSTIMEEFLEHLIPPCFPDVSKDLEMGGTRCVSSMQFSVFDDSNDSLMTFEKDQDFAISRKLHAQVCYQDDFVDAAKYTLKIPLVAVECKTYIDKTMFQESVATANRMKQLCPQSRYFVLAEWLAMQPVDTSHTGIDCVFIARKAKRFRDQFNGSLNTYKGRQEKRQEYLDLLDENKLEPMVFLKLIQSIKPALTNYVQDADTVLERGHF